MLAGRVVRNGDVIEASPPDARLLIGIGKAIQVAMWQPLLFRQSSLSLYQNHNPPDGGLSHDHSKLRDQN
jgi:hypothetical protein